MNQHKQIFLFKLEKKPRLVNVEKSPSRFSDYGFCPEIVILK